MVKLHGTAIKSTTYVNTYQAERLAPNDVLDLELRYKNQPEVLAILNMAVHPYAAIEDAIEEHDEDSEDLEELDRMRGDVTGELEEAEESLENILDTLDLIAGADNGYTPAEQVRDAVELIISLQTQLRNLLSRTEAK